MDEFVIKYIYKNILYGFIAMYVLGVFLSFDLMWITLDTPQDRFLFLGQWVICAMGVGIFRHMVDIYADD